MALPICFVAILLAIKNAVKNNEDFQSETIEPVIPELSYTALSFQDYVTAMQATRQCVLNSTGEPKFWISGIPDQGYVPDVVSEDARFLWNGSLLLTLPYLCFLLSFTVLQM